MIVTILMDNSFQRRKELDRSFKIVGANIDKNNQEEQFLKHMLKENILNKDNFQDLEFSLNNMKAEYSKKESILNIKNKDKTSGLFKESYYEIKVINDDIILSKRGNYEFVNKNLKD
ncbi:TPA: type IV pilin [Clostridium perfringens]|nr:type IV pilin [Clostridium perfringens]